MSTDYVRSVGGPVDQSRHRDTAISAEGECAALIRCYDWSKTSLGPIPEWSASMRAIINLILHSPVAMVTLWGEQGIMLYNDAYSRFAARRHPELLGKEVRSGWPEVADFNDNVMRVGLAGGTLSYKNQELTLHRHGKAEQVFMDLDYSPLFDDEGSPAGVLAIVSDTTEQVEAQRLKQAAESALTREHQRTGDVLENMAEGFVLLDRDFCVLKINAEALRLERRSQHEVIGKVYRAFNGFGDFEELGALFAKAMLDRRAATLDQHLRMFDGEERWLDVRAYPSGDGLAIFYRDVTAKHRALNLAAAAAERVELALDAGAILGTWVWDIPKDTFIADERFAAAFDLDPDLCRSGLPLEAVMTSIHDDDRQRVAAAIGEAIKNGGTYRCEYRVRQHDGVTRWVEASGLVELDSNGSAVRFPGVLIDIDLRRSSLEERDRATKLLKVFAEAVPGVVYAKDRAGRMLVANRGTTDLIGKSPEHYLGLTDVEFLDDEDQARAVMATDQRIMETGQAEQIEEEVRLPDGSNAVWLSTKAPLINDPGEVVGLIGSSVDITARVKMERALAEALNTSDVLLHEVNHRVKNSLQIVTSLLMLQAGQAQDPALRESLMEARGRIAVIASMHQRLYLTSDHDRVDFGAYLEELAVETLSLIDGQERIELERRIEPGIVILLSQAVPLALVVSELLTNALKYAFPARSGRLLLSLSRTADDFVIVVADDGVGLPDGFDPNNKAGLGMRIITSLVRQVRGTISFQTEGGTMARICVPAVPE